MNKPNPNASAIRQHVRKRAYAHILGGGAYAVQNTVNSDGTRSRTIFIDGIPVIGCTTHKPRPLPEGGQR